MAPYYEYVFVVRQKILDVDNSRRGNLTPNHPMQVSFFGYFNGVFLGRNLRWDIMF